MSYVISIRMLALHNCLRWYILYLFVSESQKPTNHKRERHRGTNEIEEMIFYEVLSELCDVFEYHADYCQLSVLDALSGHGWITHTMP